MIYIILFFIYGVVIGSFCNVVIHRLYTKKGIILKQSHCPHCNSDIAWKDNVPLLSYMMLRGKCRVCRKNISIQYPLVEGFTGILFAAVGIFYVSGTIDNLLIAVLYAFVFSHLVVIFVYDWKHMEIPMGVMWLAIMLSVGINIMTDFCGHALENGVWESVSFLHGTSALVAFCFFFGLSYVSDETWMGYGDSFIAIVLGLILGPIGTFSALLIAFCVGAVYGVGLMIVQKRSLKTEIPFGPFLIFGLFVTFVLQHTYPELFSFFI